MDTQTKAIVPWENLSTEQLAIEFSDYHKALHGFRPRYVDPTDRAELLHQLKRLDELIEFMKSTPRGRETLREDGWIV
jgi:hypothetical protein